MVELADARDLKSLGRDTIPVRSRSAAPKKAVSIRILLFLVCYKEGLTSARAKRRYSEGILQRFRHILGTMGMGGIFNEYLFFFRTQPARKSLHALTRPQISLPLLRRGEISQSILTDRARRLIISVRAGTALPNALRRPRLRHSGGGQWEHLPLPAI